MNKLFLLKHSLKLLISQIAWLFMSSVRAVIEGNDAAVVVVVAFVGKIVVLFCVPEIVVPVPAHLPNDVKLSIILVNIIKNNGIIAPFAIEESVPIIINSISILDTYRYF